jgi:fructosamine-3-kinase
MLPAAVAEFITEQGWGQISALVPVVGGCINNGHLLTTTSGPKLFLKANRSAPPEMFQREAEGLAALAAASAGPRVPSAWLAGEQFLLLEYLSPAPSAADYWPAFGRRLAQLHARTQNSFGFDHDNYLGTTPQPNGWLADGYAFYAKRRIGFQAARAHHRGLLSAADLKRAEALAHNLPNLVPPQPPSLIHGDLWLGNILPGPDGQACLIDPAAHYGWAEAELAMTALFGRPPDAFYAAYTAESRLEPGYQTRFDVYNLYHLLNHLNLFGSSYRSSVNAILTRYA